MSTMNHQKVSRLHTELKKTTPKSIAHHQKHFCRKCSTPIRFVKAIGEWIAFNLNGNKHICTFAHAR